MEAREYIESGILELYVYGLLSESENTEVNRMAKNHKEVDDEIVSIEKAIVDLSTSFSPFLSAENFDKIREKLSLKYSDARTGIRDNDVVQLKPRSNAAAYLGWAAALVFLCGIGYLFYQQQESNVQIVNSENEKTKLQENIMALEIKNRQKETALAIIRDKDNTIVTLGGQAAAPESFAKVYWNQETQVVYVDAAGLPEPPEGMVYQVWALKLNPLTPTSIGLLENFTADNQRIFSVNSTGDADAFGITLEPAGGSPSPTMEQLYTLGTVKV